MTETCLIEHREGVRTICVAGEEAQICMYCSGKKEQALNTHTQALKAKLFDKLSALAYNPESTGDTPMPDAAKDLRCPHCKSTQIYFRVRENNWFCRHCSQTCTKEELNKEPSQPT